MSGVILLVELDNNRFCTGEVFLYLINDDYLDSIYSVVRPDSEFKKNLIGCRELGLTLMTESNSDALYSQYEPKNTILLIELRGEADEIISKIHSVLHITKSFSHHTLVPQN
jgi:hypothetical protein